MRRAIVAALLIASIHATVAQAATPEPYQLVRALEVLQDDVAKGSVEARAGQRKMLDQMASEFLKAEPSAWTSQRNLQAAALFVLNGGSPVVIRKVIDFKAIPDFERDLIVGAMAYVAGREDEARLRLQNIDPEKLGAVLGGNLALAMGSLMMRQDGAKAIRYFSIARLLLPGTLIEESALRRQVFMHFDAEDVSAFSNIGAQYLRRFGKSAYSDQFRERLDLAIRHLARSADPSVIDKLNPLFEETGGNYNASLLLLLSREGLLYGRVPIARSANERARALSNMDAALQNRLKLYTAFVQVFSDRPEAAREALDSVAPLVETAEDRAIVEAGTRLLGHIVQWPPAVETNSALAGRETTGIQADATKALQASLELLARADR